MKRFIFPASLLLFAFLSNPARSAGEAGEPNNTNLQATPLAEGQSVVFRLDKEGDVDWFALELPAPAVGLLDVSVRGMPLTFAPRLGLYEGTNRVNVSQTAPGVPLFVRHRVERPGRYLFQLDAGDPRFRARGDKSAAEELTLLVRHYPADPAHEPNDEEKTAARIDFGRPHTAGFYPLGETDAYSVVVPGDGGGLLRVAVSNCPAARVRVSLRGPSSRWLGDTQAALTGDPVLLERVAETGGVHVILLQDVDGTGLPPNAYRLQVDYTAPPADGGDTWARARPLTPGAEARNALERPGQAHHYSLVVPAPGRGLLRVVLEEVPDTIAAQLTLFDEAGKQLDSVTRRRGQDLEILRPLTQPGKLRFRVQDGSYSLNGLSSSGEDDFSPRPYRVRADFLPAIDAGEPNDTHDTARVLKVGEPAEGTLFPRGDQDVFKLSLPAGRAGVLRIRLEGMPDHLFPYLRVDDVARQRLDGMEKTVDREQAAVWTRNLPDGGDYFLIVRDGVLDGRGRESWDDSSSLQPYRLSATFTEVLGVAGEPNLSSTFTAVPGDAGEPNGTPETATPLTLGKPVSGLVFPSLDSDWFSFALGEKQVGPFRVDAGPFHDGMHPVLELCDAGKQVIRRWQTRQTDRLVGETVIDAAGSYYLRLSCGPQRVGAEVGPHEQFDTRPYTLTAGPVSAPVGSPVPEVEGPALFHTATRLAAGAVGRGTMTNRMDRDVFRFRVTQPSEVVAEVFGVPADLDLVARAYFVPGAAAETPPPRVLYVHGPRNDFSLSDRFPDVSFERFEEGAEEPKSILANPAALARYRAVILECPHRPEALDLANPRIRGNLDEFMRQGGRVLVLTPFCDLPDLGVKVEQINSWQDDQTVDIGLLHPLLPAGGAGRIRGWNVQENIGFLTGWQAAGFRALHAHASGVSTAAVTIARAEGKGFLVVDTQTIGHHNAFPHSDWKVRSFLGLPAVDVLGDFNNTALQDGARWEGQPEAFRYRAKQAGELMVVLFEREGRPSAKPEPYFIRFRALPAPLAASPANSPARAAELPVVSGSDPVAREVPAGGPAWFRWKGLPSARVSVSLDGVPADADPVLRVYRREPGGAFAPPRVLYLHGNNGDARLDANYPELEFERIEWNDERADAVLRDPARLGAYAAVVVDAATRVEDFGLNQAATMAGIESYARAGGTFLLCGPQAPVRVLDARFEDVNWRDENLRETGVEDPALRFRRRGDRFMGWRGYDSLGGWALPTGVDWRVPVEGSFGSRVAPVLAIRSMGKGRAILSAQPLGTTANHEEARWQLYSFLGVTNRWAKVAEIDRSCGLTAGGAEEVELEQEAGDYFLEIRNRYDTAPSTPMRLLVSAREDSRPLEPDDSPAQARRVEFGAAVSATLSPAGDTDWRRVAAPEPGLLQLGVDGAPDNLDPVLELRQSSVPARAMRVLYLEADPANEVDASRFPGTVWTRVDASAAGAGAVLSRLPEFDTVVIASISDAAQFGLNQPSAESALRSFAEKGGHVLMVAPRWVAFGENVPAWGGKLEAWSSEWDAGGWKALNLTDGAGLPGQQGRGWCCGNGARFPHALTWSFQGESRTLDRVSIWNNASSAGSRSRQLEVWAGPATNALKRVGAFTALDRDGRQEFSFPAVDCRFVRLVVATNFGHAVETQLGEAHFHGPRAPRGFFGARHEAAGDSPRLSLPDPLHWIVRADEPVDVNGWPDARCDVRWLDAADAGFQPVVVEEADATRRGVTAVLSLGKGWIVLDAQRLTSPVNRDAAEWKWHRYLGTSRVYAGRTNQSQGWGIDGAETRVVETRGGEEYLIGISDLSDQDNRSNRSALPYRFTATFRPAAQSSEPNDTWDLATPLTFGQPARDALFPAGDRDWFRFRVDRASMAVLRLEDVPSSLDPVLELYRAGPGARPVRVLYLTCRADARLDQREYGPVPVSFRRIVAGSSGEQAALDQMADADVVILEGLDDRARFGLDRPEALAKIERFAAQGGTFVLLAPDNHSHSAIGKGSGARLVEASPSANYHGYHAQNLVDGRWETGNARGGWASADRSPFPHRMVFERVGGTLPKVNRLVIHNTANPTNSAVREVELRFADRNEPSAFVSAGTFVCSGREARSSFTFPAASPRFVEVRILSNHGDARETQCGEIELFGPGDPEGPFGVPRYRGAQSGWGVARVDPAHWLATGLEADAGGKVSGSWRRTGYFTDWKSQGFLPVFMDPDNTNEFAVTLAKPVGKGWIVLDTHDLGAPDADARQEPKMLAYLRLPATRLGRFDRTVSSPAGGAPEVAVIPVQPGEYHLRVADNQPLASALGTYRLSLDLRPVDQVYEPNDSPALATPLAPNQPMRTTFFPERDEDWFALDLTAPGPLVFETLRVPGEVDARVEVYKDGALEQPLFRLGYAGAGMPVAGRMEFAAPGRYLFKLWNTGHEGRFPDGPLEFQVRGPVASAKAAPLRVLAAEPPPGATNISSRAGFAIYFSAPLDSATASVGALVVSAAKSGEVSGKAVVDPAAGMVSFVPDKPLPAGEAITLRLSPKIRAATGQALEKDFPWSVAVRPEQPVEAECVFRLELSPTSPLGPGTATVTILPSSRLKSAPELTAVTEGGQALPVGAAARDAAGTWKASLTVPPGLARQSALFTCAATDAAGRRAKRIQQGARFEVDGTPPPAPAAPIAKAARGGAALISWKTPPGADDIGQYEVHRLESNKAPVSDATRVARVPGANAQTHVDPTPRDATWHYRVVAVDQAGNAGPPSPSASVTTDRVPPRATVARAGAKVVQKPGIELSWSPAVGADFAGYALFRFKEGNAPPDVSTSQPWSEAPADKTSLLDYPGDGAYRYWVAARDEAGNLGPLSPAAAVVLDTRRAGARITLDRKPPLGAGDTRVTVTLTEPLSASPVVQFRPPDGTFAALAMRPQSATNFQATVRLAADVPDGWAEFRVEGKDLHGNEGVDILEGQSFTVDARPPLARVHPSSPGFLAVGTNTVFVDFSESVRDYPDLLFGVAGVTNRVPLRRVQGLRYLGLVVVDPRAPNGPAEFGIDSIDAAGNRGGRVEEGAKVVLDTVPPEPPPDVRVTPGPDHTLDVSWLASTREPVAYYRVHTLSDGVHRVRLEDRVRDLRARVRPAGPGAISLTVTAVDRAGNESAPAPPVRAEVDLTAPPPPTGVAAEILPDGRVRVSWKPGAARETVSYTLFRSTTPLAVSTNRARVAETAQTFLLDEPGVSGVLHYGVVAVDAAGNASAPATAAPLAFDIAPPVASLIFTPQAGKRPYHEAPYVDYEIPVVSAGEVKLELRASEPLSAKPRLRMRSRTRDIPVEIPLTGQGDRWSGTWVVPEKSEDGLVVFLFEGVDPADNHGTEITRGKGNVVWVDTQAPPPITTLVVHPRPLGKMECAWQPPPGEVAGWVTYSLYRSDKPFFSTAGLTPVARGLREPVNLDSPPSDGEYHYAVVAVDQAGLIGKISPSLSARSDGKPPAAPANLKASVPGEIVLTWDAPENTPLTYRVFRGREPIAETTAPLARDNPEKDGEHVYSVVAVDAAGNASLPSAEAKVQFNSTLPSAVITTDPGTPLRSSFRVTLGGSVPLRAAPDLHLRLASGEMRRVPLAAAPPADGTTWTGSVAVDETTPNGPAEFLFSGVSKDGKSGGRIRAGASVRVDSTPPTAAVAFVPPAPLRAGKAVVVLTPSEPLSANPSLQLVLPGAAPLELAVTATGTQFRAEFTVAEGSAEGIARLSWSGLDLAGNEGRVLSNPTFEIDQHPPKAPLVLAATPAKGNRVSLSWQAPVYAANETGDRIVGYHVYAARADFASVAGLTPLARSATRIPWELQLPSDGAWHLAVTSVDAAGLESPLSARVKAVADGTAPEAPVLATPVIRDGGLDLSWEASADAVAFRLEVQDPDDPGFRSASESLTARTHGFRPLAGGRYAFRAFALDALGQESPASLPVAVFFEQQAPLAVIKLDSAILGAGSHAVALESTLPLAAAPTVVFTDAAGKAQPIALTGAERNWRGTLTVSSSLAEGEGVFSFKGVSRNPAGETFTGDAILAGERARLDFTAPTAALAWNANDPGPGGKAVLNAGRHPFRLVASEPLRADPALTFTARGADATPIPLARLGELEWGGVLAVSTNTPGGAGIFEVELVDAQGNRGSTLRENRVVEIDLTPPARIAHLRAAVLPGGRCRVEWTAPMGPDGRPDARATRFHLYRGQSEIIDATGLEPYRVLRHILGFVDTPGADLTYHYTVAAVDDAGNVGPLSANARAVIDKTAPSPPSELRATVMTNGVVHLAWTAPPGEKPLFYNVYLEEHPILGTAGLNPMNRGVTWTEIYGTPNHNGKYHFAVTSVDGALNESAASANASLDYTAIPPVASFFLEPDIWLSDGEHPLRLETSRALAEPPVVEVNSESGIRRQLMFQGGGKAWTSALSISPAMPEGTYGFVFRGKDEAGNTGDEIARTPLFHVDRTAPLPPSDLRVAPDPASTVGAVSLTWRTPKRPGEQTEVPAYGYHLYRSDQPITSVKGLAPVQIVRAKFANLDEFKAVDIPPLNGAFHYAVTSLDLARNESAPSPSQSVTVRSNSPRASIALYRLEGTRLVPVATDEQGTPILGRGKTRVKLTTAAPLKEAPKLSWAVKDSPAAAQPVTLREKAGEWWGDVEPNPASGAEEDAEFTFSGVSAEGAAGNHICLGAAFRIDASAPAADLILPSVYKMRVNARERSLLTPPVRAGPQEVILRTPDELAAAPRLTWSLAGGAPVAVPLTGFGREWRGYLEVPDEAHDQEGVFAYSGADRAGNVSSTIAKVKYEHELDDGFPHPRRIASYASTGGKFRTDTRAPDAPKGLETEMRKLGVAVIQWKEPPGEPNSYNLYRSLTPIPDTRGLTPIQRDLYSTVAVDAPPVDGHYYYAVTAVDFAGNESGVYESKGVFIDSIKPELKIKAAPVGDDFVILVDEDSPPELSLTLRFPGREAIEVNLGGSSGELAEYKVRTGPSGERQIVLPQMVGFFNGRVEVIVHSPDPEGNVVEERTELEMKAIPTATGGEVGSVDEQARLIIPPGIQPVIPDGPGKTRRVGGYENLFFIKYANIPKEKPADAASQPPSRERVDPLPPGLEIVGVPYVVEINQPPEEPLELKGTVSQADLSQLKPLMAKLKMKVPTQYSDMVEKPDYLKSRLQVLQWVPASASAKAGRWEPLPDIEIDPKTKEIVVPVNRVTTYVIVAERTPPSVLDLQPGREEVVGTFQPEIRCRLVDKGTGVAVGAENRIVLTLDGRRIPEGQLEISKGDPTEVWVSHRPRERLAPGRHTVGVRVEDVVENVADVKWQFLIDAKPPAIVARAPAENERVPVTRPLIQVQVSDEGGLNLTASHIAIDGERLPSSALRHDAETGWLVARPPVPLTGGTHRVEARVVDLTGQAGTAEWSFAVDVDAPGVSGAKPAEGGVVPPGKTEFLLQVSDPLGASQVLDLRLNGQRIPSDRWRLPGGYAFDPLKGSLSFSADALPTGEHEVEVLVADDLGNAATRRWTFKSDAQAGLGPATTPAWTPAFLASNRLARAGTARAGIPVAADPRRPSQPEIISPDRARNPPTRPVDSMPAAELAAFRDLRRLLAEAGYEESRGDWDKAAALYAGFLKTRTNAVVSTRLENARAMATSTPKNPPAAVDPVARLQSRRARAEAGYLEAKGDWAGALRAYETSLAVEEDPEVRTRVAKLRARLATEKPATGVSGGTTPSVVDPATLAASRRLRAEGAYLELKGEFAQAVEAYEKARALVPDPALDALIAEARRKAGRR